EDGIRDFHVTGVQTCALPIFQLAYTYLLDGQSERALKSFGTALQLSELMPGDHVRRDAAIRSAVVHALRGSRSRALSCLQLADQIGRASCRERVWIAVGAGA